MDVDPDALRVLNALESRIICSCGRSPRDEVRDAAAPTDRPLDIGGVVVGGGDARSRRGHTADDIAVDREDGGERITHAHARA